ncbi:hypothetical protein J7T55_015255 [Diaporthe amygdali]|uniref:uncharacterized protein n=1 Tax=Phomopsis amygdali TaxID=1214568 RepID=UPI0022FEA9CC|nr:uncharacterized protein J7T55_015255 [Diaporthe amygdali]KAJ0120526.1 hypothetical protein J7T55_015255 [Diaporthe amygdali]
MTTSAPAKQPVLNGQGQPPVQQGLVKDFVRIIRQLSTDEGYQNIAGLILEVENLRTENEELKKKVGDSKTMKTEILAAVQEVENENQDMKDQCAKKDADLDKAQTQASATQGKFQKAQNQIANLKMELVTNKDEIDKTMANLKQKEAQLESARKTEQDLKASRVEGDRIKKQYDMANQELAAFKKLALPLKSLNETEFRTLVRQLVGLFDEAHQLALQFFGQLTQEPQVTHTRLWEDLTKDVALSGIPLPPGNSEAARQMRVAAVLRLMAENAYQYIFQPVYLTENGMEVAEILSQVSSSHAHWMRSVLLNMNLKGQRDNGLKRTKTAANQVSKILGFLITSPVDGQAFNAAVLQWYEKACKIWMTIQQLEIRFEAQFEPLSNEQGMLDWEPLSDLFHEAKSSTGCTTNGTKSKSEPKDRLLMKDIAAEVWPEFLATYKEETSICVLPGYVLVRAQTAVAEQEVKEAASLERAHNSRRVAPGKPRAVAVMSGPNGSKEKFSFLSQGV